MVKSVTQRFFNFIEALLDNFEAQFCLGLQYNTISQTLITLWPCISDLTLLIDAFKGKYTQRFSSELNIGKINAF